MTDTAFIIDLKNSRDMNTHDRISVQERLLEIADAANLAYGKRMRRKLEFSGGDSIQGLFTDPSSAVCCYTFIRSAIYPHEIRCGIGTGDVIDMPYDSTNMMDGTAYHNAREMLSFAKTDKHELLFSSGSPNDLFVNQYLAAAQLLMSKQSSKQKIVNNLVFLLDPVNIADIDRKLYNSKIQNFIRENISMYRGLEPLPNTGTIYVSDLCDQWKERRRHVETYGDHGHRSGSIISKKTIERNVQSTIGKILNVSSENIRQMIVNGDVEIVRSLFISASLLAEYLTGGGKQC